MKHIVKKLTLKEKALLMSGKTVWETYNIDRLKIRSYFLADGPTGIRKQEGSSDHLGLNESIQATCFPTSATVANSWNLKLAEKLGEALGLEAVDKGVDVLLGPGFNIKKNPRGGRNFEYFSEDPYLSGKLAASYIRGIQSTGTIASPKHYAVNNQELKRLSTNSIVDDQALHEIYLKPFEIAVKEGRPKSIMTSYNLVNGIYANEHKYLLQDVLVKEWSFDGFVVTDWGGSNDHVAGVIAGSHLEMPTTGIYGALEIEKAVKEGTLDENVLDERVTKLLESLEFSNHRKTKKFDIKEHHELAQVLAEESIVLLKNSEQILPIKDSKESVCLIGDFAETPRYQGSGSSLVNATSVESLKEEIEKEFINYLGYAKGFNRINKPDDKLLKEAIELASRSRVTLVNIGLDEASEVEGKDRSHINISSNQISLLKELSRLETKVVVIISAGSVIDMSWEKYADAILHTYLPGQAGASAIVNILKGNTNPSGKLNETYPLSDTDIPLNKEFPSENFNIYYKDSIYVGYRYYDTAKKDVRYPFGYGLSYTTFEYSNLEVLKDRVKFTLRNTGEYPGSEVTQLYIRTNDSKVLRPLRELKGFKKVHLEVNEEKEVEILFDEHSFAFYNSKTNQFEREDNCYIIEIGSSSRHLHLQGDYEIQGNTINYPYSLEKLEHYKKADIDNVSDREFEILLNGKIKNDNDLNTLHMNSTIDDFKNANSATCRFVRNRLVSIQRRSESKGKANLNVLFILNLPIRGISKMTNGMMSYEMAESILYLANTNIVKGLVSFIKAWRHAVKEKKQFLRELEEEVALIEKQNHKI